MTLEIIPVRLGEVDDSTDLVREITGKIQLRDSDILVVSHKMISKHENRVISLDTITPSLLAQGIASEYQKDPRIVELILAESKRIVRMKRGVLIVETHHGFVCANAGVDESNVARGHAALLPANPDYSARELRHQLEAKTGRSLAVIISDTFGRPFREGQTDCAIGLSGIIPIRDHRGTCDSTGRQLRVSQTAIVDEVCAAAELVKGKAEGCPVSVVRNLEYDTSEDTIGRLLRRRSDDLFY